MKTKNDYLAEYIREKCPAVERSIDFSLWKFSKSLTGIAARVSKAKKESSLTGKDVDMIMLDEFGTKGEKDAENRKK